MTEEIEIGFVISDRRLHSNVSVAVRLERKKGETVQELGARVGEEAKAVLAAQIPAMVATGKVVNRREL